MASFRSSGQNAKTRRRYLPTRSMKKRLSQSTVEKLGHYVYTLTDSRNNMVFYVGKGKYEDT